MFENLVLTPGKSTCIELELEDNTPAFNEVVEKKADKQKHKLEALTYTDSGSCFSITREYTYEEVFTMFALYGFNADLYE